MEVGPLGASGPARPLPLRGRRAPEAGGGWAVRAGRVWPPVTASVPPSATSPSSPQSRSPTCSSTYPGSTLV